VAIDSPNRQSPPDLRERRRRELTRVIAASAIGLFERNGFSATTIDDIAAEAGISRTTFFRYCATKEAAVLVDDAGLESELIAVAEGAPVAHALGHLESAWDAMTEVFDADPEGRERFLRVRRVMRGEPSLRAAGLARDAQLTEQLAIALHGRPGLAELDACAVAERFALGMRLTFDEWVRQAHRDGPALPPALKAVYQDVRAALSRADGGLAR
jgi:AcrR family transcriptional regulator